VLGHSRGLQQHVQQLGAEASLDGVVLLQISAGASSIQVQIDDSASLSAVEAMLAIMYDVEYALEDLEQPTILQLALLANRYDAPKVLSTALQQLKAEPLAPAALELWWQLPGCWEEPFWPLLGQAIDHKLSTAANRDEAMQEIVTLLLFVTDGDLELLWTSNSMESNSRRRLLMQLEADVLAAFLEKPELWVVSEDTVLYTVVEWLENSKRRDPSCERYGTTEYEKHRLAIKALQAAVRFQQLTPACLLFIAPKLDWVDEQHCQSAAFSAMQQSRLGSSTSQGLVSTPAEWLQGQHNISSMESHTMTFITSLEDIETLTWADAVVHNWYDQQDTDGLDGSKKIGATCTIPETAFGGRTWHVYWAAQDPRDSTTLGLYVCPHFPGLVRYYYEEEQAGLVWPWCPDGLMISCAGTTHQAEPTHKHNTGPFGIKHFFEGGLTDVRAAAQDGSVSVTITVPRSCCC